MNPLTRRDVIAHQAQVPWPHQRQVEQDLLLCRAMAALFNDNFLRSQIAMRGGTLLHKVHLAPASRYSEDIDLVVFGNRPEDHVAKAVRRVLKPEFGTPSDSIWDTIRLAIRNTVKPSRVLRLTYSVQSVSEPGATLDIVVEANVTERSPHRAVVAIPFEFAFRDATVAAQVNGYDLHEMLGTKLRALFQRKRGRDLFDLYWALTALQRQKLACIEFDLSDLPRGITYAELTAMFYEDRVASRWIFNEKLAAEERRRAKAEAEEHAAWLRGAERFVNECRRSSKALEVKPTKNGQGYTIYHVPTEGA